MSKYLDSRVYLLRVGDDTYVGSTVDSLRQRLTKHKSAYNKNKMKQRKLYQAIDGMPNKANNVTIELVEQVSCDTREQLLARERHWIETLEPTLNMVVMLNKTKEDKRNYDNEFRQRPEAKVKKAERDKAYREKNREAILEKKREYCKTHPRKPLTQEQKDEKNAKRRERVCCPHCALNIAQGALARHIKLMHP